MSFQSPNQFWRRVIVGDVYGVAGVLAGMLLGLIPGTGIILMLVCGLFAAWLGSRQERDPFCWSDEAPIEPGGSRPSA